MSEEGPEIYIFDGDDEYAINASIDKLRSRLGDAMISDMNTTRLDGRSITLGQIKDAVAAIPFLAAKRLVIIAQPTARLQDKSSRDEFIKYLEAEKLTAKLILVEYHFLTSEADRRDNKLHWLEKWALSPQQASRVFLRHHVQPSGGLMVKWIQDQVKLQGGQITNQAAVTLANQVGDDSRLAAQEITKLLTYIKYSRPIEIDDVEHLTPFTARVGDFALVNAIRDRNQKKAQALLHLSLQDEDPLQILQSIVYQVRLLLIAREILDERLTVNDFPKPLKISYYPAKLAIESVSRFSMKFLETIYHRLLEADEAIKTGLLEQELALELLIVELTS